MRRHRRIPALMALLVAFVACDDTTGPENGSEQLSWNFDEGTHGWAANFADYPVGEDEFYELESGHEPLPEPLGDEGRGLLVGGNNHSDDLLMYITRRVDGLDPNTTYRVRFEIEIASNAAAGCAGAGGSPGESVWVKAGAATTQPVREEEDAGYWRLNIDIGAQSGDGENGFTLGDVAVEDSDCLDPVYALKRLASPRTVDVETDDSGALWLIAAIDSGFEATSRIWFTKVEARLTPVG